MKIFKEFHWTYVFAILFVFGFVIVSCGGGDGSPTTPSTDGGGPFTGTFVYEGTGQYWGGSQTQTATLILTQNGTLLTGTHTNMVVWENCCTAGCVVSISGTVDGTSAIFSGPGCEDTCGCGTGPARVQIPAGTATATLVDNGRILRVTFTWSSGDQWDYVRQ